MVKMRASLQAVILAGGLGTRLRPITDATPKAMIPICGRPFLEYQLALLKSHGVHDIVLCIGYRGGMIQDHFGDGSRFGLSIRYGDDGAAPLGTAGALKNVERHLNEAFFVTYGDGYLRCDYGRAMGSFRRRHCLGLMMIYKNSGRYDRSNVVVRHGFVAAYDKTHTLPGMRFIDFGVALLSRTVLGRIPQGVPMDLQTLYNDLIAERQLLAYQAKQRFYEIGSPSGLLEFEALVRTGRLATMRPFELAAGSA
jgi:N-acetyl-alpha-D-muramate 1-phosphate uridylyltransferase